MLKFLKDIFSKKEPEIESVALHDLPGWFDSKAKLINSDLDKHIIYIKQKLSEEIEKTKNNIDKLKSAELRNPNIPHKAKHLMEGNREAYVRIVSNFISNIDLPEEYSDIIAYHDEFNSSFESLEKSTGRSYNVLQEFFANEATDIAINIKNIAKIIKELDNAISSSGMKNIESVKDSIKELEKAISSKSRNKEHLSAKEKELSELKKHEQSLKDSIEELKNSGDYKAFLDLQEKEKQLLNDISINNDSLIQSFSVLNKALKKYSKISFEHSKLIDKYIEDPVKALLHDKDLVILNILQRLESNIGSLSLDPKKKSRSLNEIKALDRQFFSALLKKHEELSNALKDVREKIKTSHADKKLTELKHSLEKAGNKISFVSAGIETLKNDIAKIDIEEIKKKLENKINKTLNTNISIS